MLTLTFTITFTFIFTFTFTFTSTFTLALGIAYTPGVIPENWMKWVRSNFARGVPEYKLCSMLTTKGFHPARNSGLMQVSIF